MFNKENNSDLIKNAETIIGQSIKVKGNFHGQGNMIIEGSVEGSIKTNNFLLVNFYYNSVPCPTISKTSSKSNRII